MKTFYQDEYTTIYNFDAIGALYNLPPQSISCVVTAFPLDWVDGKGVHYHLADVAQYAKGIHQVLEALKEALKTDARVFFINFGGAIDRIFYADNGHMRISVMPEEMAQVLIEAGSKEGDVVLDPFAGSGTTGLVAKRLKRKSILIDNNYKICKLIKERICNEK